MIVCTKDGDHSEFKSYQMAQIVPNLTSQRPNRYFVLRYPLLHHYPGANGPAFVSTLYSGCAESII
jgi:hypothetical protein